MKLGLEDDARRSLRRVDSEMLMRMLSGEDRSVAHMRYC